MTPPTYEYVVVGSGAGGGVLAARLAELGHTVLLLEAGGDPVAAGSEKTDGSDRLPADYEVPAFHPFASENDAFKWDFFVRHYASDERQKKDPKYYKTWRGNEVDGVLYPRSSTLGGCTSHHALFTIYPNNEDWDHIERLTGDSTWSAKNMRKYFERMERCEYRDCARLFARLGLNPSRHGFDGWLPTEMPIPLKALKSDINLIRTIISTVDEEAITNERAFERLWWALEGKLDPNDWRLVKEDSVGIRYAPISTRKGRRYGARERVLEVAARYPDRLHYELNALVTHVLLDDTNTAIGVEYLKGANLYRAHNRPSDKSGIPKRITVSREVILSGGTFNTPQLLMLSGIGPREELEAWGIPVRVDLSGVGSNMQDRYEIGVVYRMNFPAWEVLKNATYTTADPQYKSWRNNNEGVYTTNGTILAVIKRSLPERPIPDLFIFALLGLFKGYFPTYSELIPANLNTLTWAVLKGHTQNSAGTVKLRSKDPCDVPAINFSYFDESNDNTAADLQSMVEGIKYVRTLAHPLIEDGLIKQEEVPGYHIATDEQLAEYVKYNAWGHHASCSCPIGDPEHGGVVNGDFQVHGTTNLRIVDASVFPKIPGFFIVTSIYMIAEKAADVISAAAQLDPGARRP